MKINILNKPPDDIFKTRKKYILLFGSSLALACLGVLLGVYAILFDTRYYGVFEKTALGLFFASALLITYFGEKLQAYKRLYPPQKKEMEELSRKYDEIKIYHDLVVKADRNVIRAEFEECQAFAQKREQGIA